MPYTASIIPPPSYTLDHSNTTGATHQYCQFSSFLFCPFIRVCCIEGPYLPHTYLISWHICSPAAAISWRYRQLHQFWISPHILWRGWFWFFWSLDVLFNLIQLSLRFQGEGWRCGGFYSPKSSILPHCLREYPSMLHYWLSDIVPNSSWAQWQMSNNLTKVQVDGLWCCTSRGKWVVDIRFAIMKRLWVRFPGANSQTSRWVCAAVVQGFSP